MFFKAHWKTVLEKLTLNSEENNEREVYHKVFL